MIEMPSTLKDEATLAHASGTITNVRRDPTGVHVSVDGKEYAEHFVPHRLVDDNIKPGMKVEKGQKLSEGHMNPLTFLRATKNIHAVQNMMTNEMYNGIYEKEGVRRRNIEVAVRALTNLTKVKDPGNSDLLHGDVVPRSVVDEYNRGLPKGAKPVHHEPVLVGVEQIPAFSQNWLARLNYRDLKRTIQEAASSGHRAEIHGTHPIPGIAMGAEFGKPPISKPKHVY
jgi:DNA-directed RNA polymerase subunit beta'